MNRTHLAGRILSHFTVEERQAYGLTTQKAQDLTRDLELGLADLVKKYQTVTVNEFGVFYQYHYLAKPRYVNRQRVSIRFKRLPWWQFVSHIYDEDTPFA